MKLTDTNIFITLKFIFILALLDRVNSDCPDVVSHADHLFTVDNICYQYIENTESQVSFPLAEKDCRSRNGHLMTVPDNTTQSALYRKLLTVSASHAVWLGITKRASGWKWVTGGTLEWSLWEDATCVDCACAKMILSANGAWRKFECEATDWYTVYVCEYGSSDAARLPYFKFLFLITVFTTLIK